MQIHLRQFLSSFFFFKIAVTLSLSPSRSLLFKQLKSDYSGSHCDRDPSWSSPSITDSQSPTSFLAAADRTCQFFLIYCLDVDLAVCRQRHTVPKLSSKKNKQKKQLPTTANVHRRESDPQTLDRGWHVSRLKERGWRLGEEETRALCVASGIRVCMLNSIWDYMTLGELLVALWDESHTCARQHCVCMNTSVYFDVTCLVVRTTL